MQPHSPRAKGSSKRRTACSFKSLGAVFLPQAEIAAFSFRARLDINVIMYRTAVSLQYVTTLVLCSEKVFRKLAGQTCFLTVTLVFPMSSMSRYVVGTSSVILLNIVACRFVVMMLAANKHSRGAICIVQNAETRSSLTK
jgi:hypothetical protein